MSCDCDNDIIMGCNLVLKHASAKLKHFQNYLLLLVLYLAIKNIVKLALFEALLVLLLVLAIYNHLIVSTRAMGLGVGDGHASLFY